MREWAFKDKVPRVHKSLTAAPGRIMKCVNPGDNLQV